MHPAAAHSCGDITPLFTRRDLLRKSRVASAGSPLPAAQRALGAAENPLAPKAPHFPPRAKRVIFLCMRGGPSHVDTFDYKPKLTADNGKPGKRPGTKLLGSPWKFAQHGQSGLWISELFPNVAKHADELCLCARCRPTCRRTRRRSCKLHTGTSQFVRPSLGAWTLYGLGTREREPARLRHAHSAERHSAARRTTAARFCPRSIKARASARDNRPIAERRGAQPRNRRSARRRSARSSTSSRRSTARRCARDRVNPEVEGVIESYELAFRMQSEMPQVMDLSKETEATKKLYGIGDGAGDATDFGRQCLLARRFVEAGVRFVEVSHGDWDQHLNLKHRAREQLPRGRPADRRRCSPISSSAGCSRTRSSIWGGEFGRTPARAGRRRPRPQQQGLHHVDGRRRREGRLQLRPDRRLRLRGRREQSPRSTTCTPRSCTCSASTTRSSPTATPAATSGSRT